MDRFFSLETTLIDRIMKALFFHRKKSYQTFIRSSKSIIVKDGVKNAFCDVALVNEDEVNENFNKNMYKDSYHPILFQDDIGKVSTSVKEAQLANDKIVELMESKTLDLNNKKSVCIVMQTQEKGF